ncbi:hypothetical protein E2C01_006824 [Portunus trituberculatus]|uniref:Uncharacterized protein n=1 Tax=Portunus trituberculatus TaxID=210409 RepID=A0A5B7CYV1_PORTR|nr:hypothetical protein [Portunus trituberculatus]
MEHKYSLNITWTMTRPDWTANNRTQAPYPVLNDVASDGSAAITLWAGPAQVSVVGTPVSDLHVQDLAGFIYGQVMLGQGSFAKMTLGWTLGSEAPSLLLTVILNLYCFLFSRSSHLNLRGSSAGISATCDQPPVGTRPISSVYVWMSVRRSGWFVDYVMEGERE